MCIYMLSRLQCSFHEAKLHYLTGLLKESRSNPYLFRNLWKSVNDIIGRPKSYQDGIGLGTKLSLDAVNEFFCNVAVSADHKTVDQYVAASTVSSSGSFQFTSIHSENVFDLLQHLDIQKSTGPDGISARFLREVAAEIAEPLTYLYNFLYSLGLSQVIGSKVM